MATRFTRNDTQTPTPRRTAGPAASTRDDVAAFLDAVKRAPSAGGGQGRLIFALDATQSRQPTWDRACHLQAQMFQEAATLGDLAIQLLYYRGFGECRASKWVSDGPTLAAMMGGISCRGGLTQISKVLAHARDQARKRRVQALVFVGDAAEEPIDLLAHRAGELGLVGVPAFMFQEGCDPTAERAFREIARLTKGAYVRFGAGSAAQLGDLLRAVAAYAVGGRAALEDRSRATSSARLLIGQMR